jgi:hypothetical protein
MDLLFVQADRFLNRNLHDAPIDANTAAINHSLADKKLFFNDRDRCFGSRDSWGNRNRRHGLPVVHCRFINHPCLVSLESLLDSTNEIGGSRDRNHNPAASDAFAQVIQVTLRNANLRK